MRRRIAARRRSRNSFIWNGRIIRDFAYGISLLTAATDDAIVVDGSGSRDRLWESVKQSVKQPANKRNALMTTEEYFGTPETKQPTELIYGVLRVADSPMPRHQAAVGDFFIALATHVRDIQLGDVWLSPLDV